MERLKLFIPLGIFIIMCAFLLRGLSLDPTELPSALIDKPLPDFELPVLDSEDGKTVSRADLIGEPFLLNVWATWCPSCRHEHPYLLELAAQGINIVGMDYKDERMPALQWLKALKNPYSIVIFDEEGSLGLDMGVYGAPETYLVDAEGVVRYRHVGVVNLQVWTEHFAPYFEKN